MMAPAASENTTVSQEDAEAKIGNNYYATLPDAIKDAQDGDSIVLLKNLEITGDSLDWYIDFDKENETVAIDFDGHQIVFHMEYLPEKRTRNGATLFGQYFLLMDAGNLILKNGKVIGDSGAFEYEKVAMQVLSDYPYDPVFPKYSPNPSYTGRGWGIYEGVYNPRPTLLTCQNMEIENIELKGVTGTDGRTTGISDDPYDGVRLKIGNSVINKCTFSGIAASVEDSYIYDPSFYDWIGYSRYEIKGSFFNRLDFNRCFLNAESPDYFPMNGHTRASFTNTVAKNILSASFVPPLDSIQSQDNYDDLAYYAHYHGILTSSFYLGDSPSSPSSVYTKYIGSGNFGYSFATTDAGKVLASQDIPTMAKGVDQDDYGNPTSSVDQYMFVPGDADITLQFPDHKDIPVSIEFSYESEGYHSTTATYSLKDGETTKSFPLPAWTITGYDEKNRETTKEPTSPDQLSVTASTGDQTLDSQYTFAITECRPSEDGTHLSITVSASSIDPNQKYTVVYDANGGSNPPVKETHSSSESLSEPDTSKMTRTGYGFSGKWFLDKDCKFPFNYFGKTLGSAIGTLNRRKLVDENNTFTLYAGWQPKTYYIEYVLDPSGSGKISGSPDPNYKIGKFGSNIGEQPNMDAVHCNDDNMVFTGWYLDNECTKQFKYFGQNSDNPELLRLFEKDSDDTYVLTLYGGWREKEYQINFDANLPKDATDKASNIPDSETIQINNKITKPSVDPTYEDMEFQGWYLDKECTKPFNYFNKPLSQDNAESIGFDKDDKLTLYAGWDYRTYTLTYEANGGIWSDGSKEQKVTTPKTEQQRILSDRPTRPGYNFKYWEGSIFNPGDPYEGDGTTNQFGRYIDHTMKAHWEPKVYTVKYDTNSSKASGAPDSAKVTFDQDAINKPDTSRMTNEGKTFTGWYLDSACKVPFDYFNKKMDENTLSSLTKAGAIDSEDTITLYAGWKAAAAPSATPSATASTPANNNRRSAASTSNGSIFFPIPSVQKFIPATGAGGGE